MYKISINPISSPYGISNDFCADLTENYCMEELMKRLENIGFSPDTCTRIQQRFDGDVKGLESYVLFCVAWFGHDHERVD